MQNPKAIQHHEKRLMSNILQPPENGLKRFWKINPIRRLTTMKGIRILDILMSKTRQIQVTRLKK